MDAERPQVAARNRLHSSRLTAFRMNTTVALNRRIARAPIWRVGAISSLSAAAATAAWALAAETAGVPMLAGNIGAQHADPIGPMTFAVTTAVFSLLGTLVAIVAARRSR